MGSTMNPAPDRDMPAARVPTVAAVAAVLALLAAAWTAPPAGAAELPIFDAHMHYSGGAWGAYPPAKVIRMMDAAGVTGALVSSTPDDGTRKLVEAAPGRVVAGFRPYRDSADLGGWYTDSGLLADSRERLARGGYATFGEVHLQAPEVLGGPVLAGYVALIRDKGLPLHVHADAAVVDAILARWPDLKVLWAHAGFSEPPEVVDRVLRAHANVWTEVSYRAHEIMPGGDIEPAWRDVLVRHADRFMIGTDTWETDRWAEYPGLIGEHRAWLAKLPPAVAEKIAHRNAERLFGL